MTEAPNEETTAQKPSIYIQYTHSDGNASALRINRVNDSFGTDVLAALEESVLSAALHEHGGNESATARALGISRYQVRYRRKKYGI
jgi:DNA-binding NtrC family response regulator